MNAETICAWCPGFNPRDPENRGKSHGICASCQAKIDAQMDAHVAEPVIIDGSGNQIVDAVPPQNFSEREKATDGYVRPGAAWMANCVKG